MTYWSEILIPCGSMAMWRAENGFHFLTFLNVVNKEKKIAKCELSTADETTHCKLNLDCTYIKKKVSCIFFFKSFEEISSSETALKQKTKRKLKTSRNQLNRQFICKFPECKRNLKLEQAGSVMAGSQKLDKWAYAVETKNGEEKNNISNSTKSLLLKNIQILHLCT